MRKILMSTLLASLLALFGGVTALAQETPTSDGCDTVDALSAQGSPVEVSAAFFEGEELTFDIGTPGTSATLEVTGAATDTRTMSPLPGMLVYTVPADGNYVLTLTIDGADATTETFGACTPAQDNGDDDDDMDDDDDDDNKKVTICHIPPGNPAAKHTITVSESALDAHLGHGDTLGACPPGVETKFQDFTINIVIFILYDTNGISILDDCDSENCEQVVINVPIINIIDFDDVIINDDGNAIYPDIEDPEDYEFEIDNDDDDTEIVIYYLHPNPNDATEGVFQLNIYRNDTLVNDSILIFINADGEIQLWTDQSYWQKQRDAS